MASPHRHSAPEGVPAIPDNATFDESPAGFTYDFDEPVAARWRFNKRGQFERYLEYEAGPENGPSKVVTAAALAQGGRGF